MSPTDPDRTVDPARTVAEPKPARARPEQPRPATTRPVAGGTPAPALAEVADAEKPVAEQATGTAARPKASRESGGNGMAALAGLPMLAMSMQSPSTMSGQYGSGEPALPQWSP